MARSFNGTSDTIATAVNSGITTTTSLFSISVWAYSSAGSDNPPVSAFQNSGNFDGPALSWGSGLGGNNAVAFIHGAAVGGSLAQKWATTTQTLGQWYHLGCTYDGSQTLAGMLIYRNGSLVTTADNATNPTGTITNRPWTLGSNVGVNFYSGYAADAAVWTGIVLTASEMVALAAGTRPYKIRRSSLSRWWPLDGIQSPEPDLSGNKGNGTLTGTAQVFGSPFAPFTPRWPQLFPPPAPFMVFQQQTLAIPLQTSVSVTLGVHS